MTESSMDYLALVPCDWKLLLVSTNCW